ncbi:DUF2203 family protein [Egibacter rhizosphaerae]|uniref:DUF2203 family protein n=1 Tax=Egibacter rhizosphaerae TaxID=1670831 RepID=A0A411YEH1_9ACTN|nr:DUF2203 domain-containing protein [Egibacter rhizosphaerae]QBI19596.1 DUF2203 family protein [Egibacter rhizosphaerae]
MDSDPVDRYFSVEQARAALPDIVEQAERLIDLRWRLADAQFDLQHAEAPDSSVPEAKALEARVHDIVEGFTQQGLQVKGVAPLLLDFPAQVEGREGLLCWLEREPDLAYWHPVELGFMGRRPIPD